MKAFVAIYIIALSSLAFAAADVDFKTVAGLRANLKEIDADSAPITKSLQDNENCWELVKNMPAFCTQPKKQTDAFATQLSELEARLAKINQQADKANTKNADELKKLEDQLKQLEEDKPTFARLSDQEKIFRANALMKVAKLDTDFADLKVDINNTDLKLELLSHRLDQSILGAYVQDTFGRFVNSQVACDMYSNVKQRDCDSKLPTIPKEALGEVFKGEK